MSLIWLVPAGARQRESVVAASYAWSFHLLGEVGMHRVFGRGVAALSSGVLLALSACGGASNPDFVLAVQTPTATVAPGGTVPVSIAVNPYHKSQGSITLILSGLPGGVGVAPAQATVGIGSTQVFYLVVAQNAAPSTTTLTATGTSSAVALSSPITHTATLSVSVTVPPAP